MTTHLWSDFDREFTWCGLDSHKETFWGTHQKDIISCAECFDSNKLWIMLMMEKAL